MPITGLVYGAKVTSGYEVANSLRFNAGSSDSLTRTFGTPTNNKIWTYSFWMKHCDNAGVLLNTGADTSYMYFRSSSSSPVPFGFSVEQYVSSFQYRLIPDEVFRDHSAWQHIVIAFDTTQSTASNRIKIYKNGSQITSFNTEDYPSQNLDTQVNSAVAHKIGGFASSGFYDGYLAEVVFIDGQQLDSTSFGEFDSDTNIWKPKNVSGLTFGNNGFYLDFENSSSLGADVSGNGNNFTVNNLTSIDQTTDTCTNNFATLNPLVPTGLTYSNGNCTGTGTVGGTHTGSSTIGVSTGKWFAEFKVDSGGTNNTMIGISDSNQANNTSYLGSQSQQWGYYGNGGKVWNNGSDTIATLNSFTTGDIIGVALDLDNYLIYWYKNGTVQNSGTGISITAPTSTESGSYVFAIGDGSGSTTAIFDANFGNPPYSISSGNSDANGYGNFEYSVPSGYYALCTKNLAEYG